MRKFSSAKYDGVAMSSADPESEVEPINDLASQTKLVTIDRDGRKSRRMCHVGYCQESAGQLAARLVHDQLSRPGKIALLATSFSDDPRNENVTDRLAGFKEQWGLLAEHDSMPCRFVEAVTDSALATTLADPELGFIVAFDSKAAIFALKTFAAQPETRRVPMITFEPNQAIFDAIDDGRVCAAIFDDPYRSGFAAIQRLGAYLGKKKECLPAPGYGTFFLGSEVVRKENLADFRRRTRS